MATLAEIIQRTRTYLQSSRYFTDEEVTKEINLFMEVDLPLEFTLDIFSGTWKFQTIPNQPTYQLPLDEFTTISEYMSVNGNRFSLYFNRERFKSFFPETDSKCEEVIGFGNGGTSYDFTISKTPIFPGYTTINGDIHPEVFFLAQTATRPLTCRDDGKGNLIGDVSNSTIDYLSGAVHIQWNEVIMNGFEMRVSFSDYKTGVPYTGLFDGDGGILHLRPVPNEKITTIEITARRIPTKLIESLDSLRYAWLFDLVSAGTARRILMLEGGSRQSIATINDIYVHYKYLANNRSSNQATAGKRIKTIYDDSIINYE